MDFDFHLMIMNSTVATVAAPAGTLVICRITSQHRTPLACSFPSGQHVAQQAARRLPQQRLLLVHGLTGSSPHK
jgi:hypothetical protein